MLHYILQIVAFQVVFLLVYDLFLKRETFFNYNRVYLLGTAMLSIILPFVKLETVKAVAPKDFIITLPEVIIGQLSAPTTLDTQVALQAGIVLETPTTPLWQIILFSGMCFAFVFFVYKIIKLYWLKHKNPKQWNGTILIVILLKSSAAFSFFNTIFLGEYITKQEKPTILKHELIHVEHRHTIDLLFFEILRILLWFNPLVYMYQNRIKALHEYIADEHSVKKSGKKDYYQSLLNQVFETKNLSFTNTFFKQSLIKKRIIMLQKSKSKQVALIKYALLIPLVFGMLIYTSADVRAQEKEVVTITEIIEVQELSEEAQKKQILQELKKLENSGATFFEISDFAGVSKKMNQHYIQSKEDYLKQMVYAEYITQKNIDRKSKDGTLNEKDIDFNTNFLSKIKSYNEYLEEKKTSEAKERWELSTQDGILKLVVDELSDMSKEEQKRLDGLIKQMENDDFFSKIIVSEGYSSRVINSSSNNTNHDVITEEVEIQEIIESIEVPYSVIETPPTFLECKSIADNTERKKCTSNSIASFVNKNFNTDLGKTLGLSGRQRISVFFKIDKTGNVTSIGARAPHPQLEDEAKRVIGMLPQFIPGKQRGKAVTVPYSLPILFNVQGDVKARTLNTTNVEVEGVEIEEITESIEVPYSVIETPPTFPECKDLESNTERKKCTSNSVAKFVNKNFNTDLATSLGLSGRQRISVFFKIDKTGNVTSIGARAPHPQLEDEANRVIGMLPQFIPGKQRGKAVTVPYSLPIIFQVNPDSKTKPNTKKNDWESVDKAIGIPSKTQSNDIAFSKIEKAPTFEKCKNLNSEKERKACTSQTISSFVNKNFNTDLAVKIGLKGRQRIISSFIIAKNGSVTNINVKAPHPDLIVETKRVLKLIPKLIPGEHEGKKVSVSYSLPILFQVQ